MRRTSPPFAELIPEHDDALSWLILDLSNFHGQEKPIAIMFI
jgi:hypothetical protein